MQLVKIAELRSNPNIATVEMSHQGEAGTKVQRKIMMVMVK